MLERARAPDSGNQRLRLARPGHDRALERDWVASTHSPMSVTVRRKTQKHSPQQSRCILAGWFDYSALGINSLGYVEYCEHRCNG